jgi:DNA ligase-4
VNSLLDELQKSFDTAGKKKVIATFLSKTTLNEQKWLVRIILKDLKIGIGHQVILKSYH